MKKQKEEIESLGIHPTVNLIITDEFGNVKYLERAGEANLAQFLKLASTLDSNPIKKESYLLDCRGQEIYILSDFEYFKSITGFLLACPDASEICNLCTSKNLKFSFIVSY